MDSPQNLPEALHISLINVLSDNAQTRRMAEEHIKVMEIVPEFAEYLIDIALRESSALAVRQMSVLLLKRHIENNWSKLDCDTVSSRSSDTDIKTSIRCLLVHGLKQPDRMIRNSFAYCVAFIVCKDWPVDWPTCFEILDQHLNDISEYTALGVIKVYIEILHLIEGDIRLLVPVILDQLGGILINEQKYVLQVRTEAVYALTVLVNLLEGTGKEMLISKLPTVLDIFMSDLQMSCENVEDYEYKTHVIKFLTIIVHKMAKQIMPYLPSVLPSIWGMVMIFGDLYCDAIIFDKDIILETENEEGKPMGFTPLILSVFDFIQSLVESSKLNIILTDVLPDIVYYIMIFMLITKKMEDAWSNDYVQYFNDNSSEKYEMSIRITASDVLMLICREFGDQAVLPALSRAINRHISEVSQKESAIGGTCYWKIHEVCQYTLGITKDLIIPSCQAGKLEFDLRNYLAHWQCLPPLLHILLTGRCTWFAAKYSSVLPSQMYINYIDIVLNHLRSENLILKVSAIRTIIVMCEDTATNSNLAHFKQYFNFITEGVVSVLTATSNNEYLVLLALQSLKSILAIEKELFLTIEERLISILNNIFVKYNHDPEIMDQIKAVLKIVCAIDRSVDNVQHKFVPTLCNLLPHQEKVPAGVQVVAVDLLQTIVQYSKLPFRDILVQVGFSSIVKSIMKTDDHLLMMNASECLRWFLILGSEKVFSFTDGDGSTGVEFVFQAINKLLDPACPEMACKKIGRLIVTLIIKLGASLDSVHHLLKALLSKMQRVENLNVWQSLLIVFCYMFCRDTESIISFLTSIPGPTGVSAFEFVLSEWLFREYCFLGFYEHRISAVALCKILEYGVTMNNVQFDTIMVRDELISRGKDVYDDRFTMIPVLGKVFKTIVLNISCLLPGDPSNQEGSYDTDGESEASELTDNYEYDAELDSFDPFSQDPIFQIEELTILSDYMHKFQTIPNFERFYALLDVEGRNTLASINIRLQ